MMNKAKKLVKDYYNSHVDVTDNVVLTEDDVYIVWFSKTLQNWKALLSTTGDPNHIIKLPRERRRGTPDYGNFKCR